MWEIFDHIPNGWVVDKKTGSPLFGHVFITNGKSILNGGKRALLKYKSVQRKLDQKFDFNFQERQKPAIEIPNPQTPRTVNLLARARMELRLLNDIRIDLQICELEGWDKTEYIKHLQTSIKQLLPESNT